MVNRPAQRRRQQRAQPPPSTPTRSSSGRPTHAWNDVQLAATTNPLVLEVKDLHAAGHLRVRLRVATKDFNRVPTGLPVATHHEDIELAFGDRYPNTPPAVLV